MALRPWTVFRKTFYAAHDEAAAAGLSVAARLSLARARMAEESRGGGAGLSFTERLQLLLAPSAAVWLLLLGARWRFGEPDRLRALESGTGGVVLLDLLGWRAAAHLGPYQVPNLVRARLHEEPLRLLRDPLLLDHERARALGRLEQLTQRRAAAAFLAPAGEAPAGAPGAALRAIEPLLSEALGAAAAAAAAPGGGGAPGLRATGSRSQHSQVPGAAASHQAALARVILNVVAATPPDEERAVPSWVLSGLMTSPAELWGGGPQAEELRLALLLQLLQAKANCELAAGLVEVRSYLEQPGIKMKEDTLWPVKAYLLSGETPDLIRQAARLLNRQSPGAVNVQANRGRDTPSLEVKRELRNLWTTALITVGWAGLRAWRGVLDRAAALRIARCCASALGAAAALEAAWRAEERVIESEWYYKETSQAVACSAGMCLAHCALGAWALRHSVAVPFVFFRLVKDEYLDAHRSFGV